MCSHTYLQRPYKHKRNAISNRNYIQFFFSREIFVSFSVIKLLAEILILNARWFSVTVHELLTSSLQLLFLKCTVLMMKTKNTSLLKI